MIEYMSAFLRGLLGVSRNSRKSVYRLRLETLESREVPATIFVGSAGVDTFSVTNNGSSGIMVTYSLSGGASVSQPVAGNADVEIHLGSSNDSVTISNGLQNNGFIENIKVFGGDGDDSVTLEGKNVADNVTLNPAPNSGSGLGFASGLPANVQFDRFVERVAYNTNGGGTVGSVGDVIQVSPGYTQQFSVNATGAVNGVIYLNSYGTSATATVNFYPAANPWEIGRIEIGNMKHIYFEGEVGSVQYHTEGGSDLVNANASTTTGLAVYKTGTVAGNVYLKALGASLSEDVVFVPAPTASIGRIEIGSSKHFYFDASVHQVQYFSGGGNDNVFSNASTTNEFYVNKTNGGFVQLDVNGTNDTDHVTITKLPTDSVGAFTYLEGYKPVYYANNINKVIFEGRAGVDVLTINIPGEPVKYWLYGGAVGDVNGGAEPDFLEVAGSTSQQVGVSMNSVAYEDYENYPWVPKP
jgi:hypothetical protein